MLIVITKLITLLFIFLYTHKKWSWRDSNPRPNGETIRFLHAYLGLHFRATARPKPPTIALFSKISSPTRDKPLTIPDIIAPH